MPGPSTEPGKTSIALAAESPEDRATWLEDISANGKDAEEVRVKETLFVTAAMIKLACYVL